MNKKKLENIGTLYIDSTAFDSVKFAFIPFDESMEVIFKSYELPKRNAQTAEFLKKFLKLAVSGDFSQIAAFAVQTGEGSFAGMRTGISLAMGMAFAIDAPIFAVDAKGQVKQINKTTVIDYGAAPNIGVSKKKKLKQVK